MIFKIDDRFITHPVIPKTIDVPVLNTVNSESSESIEENRQEVASEDVKIVEPVAKSEESTEDKKDVIEQLSIFDDLDE